MIKLSFIFIIVLITSKIFCQEGEWVETSGECFGANITYEQGYQKALEEALVKAVQKVTGVRIAEEYFSSKSQEIEISDEKKSQYRSNIFTISSSSTSGYVTQMEVLEKKTKIDEKSNIPIYTTRVKSYVVKETGKPDLNFNVGLSLNKDIYYYRGGPDYNDRIEVGITTNQTCYINLFCLDENNSLIILFPNNRISDNKYNFTSTGETFMEIMYGNRIRFDYELPKGKDKTTETLILVATKDNISFTSDNIETYGTFNGIKNLKSSITDLNNWLVNIPLDRRTTKFESYEIRKEKNKNK